MDFVTIATTRPETIFGDTAVCINPNDERHHASEREKGNCAHCQPLHTYN